MVGKVGASGLFIYPSRNVNQLDDFKSDPLIILVVVVRAHHNHQPQGWAVISRLLEAASSLLQCLPSQCGRSCSAIYFVGLLLNVLRLKGIWDLTPFLKGPGTL